MENEKPVATIDGKRLLIQVISNLRLQDGDILFIKTKTAVSREHAEFIIEQTYGILKQISAGNKVGVMVGDDTTDVHIIGENDLTKLGLIKLHKIVETFGDDALEKLGITEKLPAAFIGMQGEFNGEINTELPEIKYALHAKENQPPYELAALYCVNITECVVITKDMHVGNNDYPNLFHLYPRLDNNYTIPKRKGR